MQGIVERRGERRGGVILYRVAVCVMALKQDSTRCRAGPARVSYHPSFIHVRIFGGFFKGPFLITRQKHCVALACLVLT